MAARRLVIRMTNPAATAEAMRNGWFHTGDSFRRDQDGRFYFVGRLKDVIRRRGENISSFALEGEVLLHPDVRECAAVAVPSEHGEDEVLICVTPIEGRTIDPGEVIADLAGRLPKFMVPRYLRVMADLPKTASGKVQKLDSAGAALWGSGLTLIPSAGTYSVADLHDAGADVILSMVHQTGAMFWSPKHLVAQKFDAAGSALWGSAPVNVFDSGSLQIGNYPPFTPDGSGYCVRGKCQHGC